MTKRFSSRLAKTLALIAACTLVLALVACGNEGRDKYAGVYVREQEVQQEGILGVGASSQTISVTLTLKKDGTLLITSNPYSSDFDKYNSCTWSVGDSCLIFAGGDEEIEVQTSDDGSRIYFLGMEYIKQ